MASIQETFQQIRQYAAAQPTLESLSEWLNQALPEYRSVACESASMEVALRDLQTGVTLNRWNEFYQQHRQAHRFHLDIGLGWALAARDISPELVLPNAVPLLHEMVFDGIGYYFGLYRSRRTIGNQEVPAQVSDVDLSGFDQGLGRRLWYHCKGTVEQVEALIGRFPADRHAALWRGVGIACGYVGGSDTARLKDLKNAVDEHLSACSMGVALAALSRYASGNVTTDVKLACLQITGLSWDDFITMIVAKAGSHEQDPDKWWAVFQENLAVAVNHKNELNPIFK